MTGDKLDPREQISCPRCSTRMQGQSMKKHIKNMHEGGRRRIHACPYCSASKLRTYSTFADCKKHLSDTHASCLWEDDPILRAEYAMGFKLDDWGRFHGLEGSDTDEAYLHVVRVRDRYGPFPGPLDGQPPRAPSTIRLPHLKGTTPDRNTTPTESEPTGAEGQGSDAGSEAGEGGTEGDFTGIRSRDTDTELEDTSTGWQAWWHSRAPEGTDTTTPGSPPSRGRGKRKADRGRGCT